MSSRAIAEIRWPDQGNILALVMVCEDCLAGALVIAEAMHNRVEVVEYYPADSRDDQDDYLATVTRLWGSDATAHERGIGTP